MQSHANVINNNIAFKTTRYLSHLTQLIIIIYNAIYYAMVWCGTSNSYFTNNELITYVWKNFVDDWVQSYLCYSFSSILVLVEISQATVWMTIYRNYEYLIMWYLVIGTNKLVLAMQQKSCSIGWLYASRSLLFKRL